MSDVKFEPVRYMMYICAYGGTCASSACHTYVMWEELSHSHLLYASTISNTEATMGTKNVFKRNCEFRFAYLDQLIVINWPFSSVLIYVA